MKNRKWTQIFASIISGILLCTFLVGFAAPVMAYAAESGSGESSSSGSSSDTGSNEKPANSAPKRTLKPYSEKIKENKNRIKILNDTAEVKEVVKTPEKDENDKDEEKKEEGKDDDDAVFTKDKIADFAKENYNDWVGEAFELIAFIKGAAEGEDVDWEKFAVETAKKVIYAFATYLGYGDITKTVIEGLEALLTSGDEPLSEMEKLTDMLGQEFNGMNDKLYEIEAQLASISNQVTGSVNEILGGTQAQIDNLEAKEILRKFMSSGEGNFSYNEFTNYVYGNNNSSSRSNEAYYNLLMRALYNGESDDVIKYYYDKLFESIYENISVFSEYYYGNVAGLDKSIACYYYDYLCANPGFVPEGSTAEFEAIQLSFELYTTYVYAYDLMRMCFAYQITDMNLNSFAKGQMNLSDGAYYSYTETDRITYANIKAEITNIEQYIKDADVQMIKNLVYILGMNDSYIVRDTDGTYREVLNNDTTYGNILDGQTIYLNVLSDELLELFSLKRSNFSYYIDGAKLMNVSEAGVINVDNIDADSFVATVKYLDQEVYSVVFTKNVTTDFSGGSGSENDPYLITIEDQFYWIAEDLNAHYKLMADISLTGYIDTMGSVEAPFNGSLDGNGHTISGLVVYSLERDEENITMTPATGLFGAIGSEGVVKNLKLANVKVKALEDEDGVGLEADKSFFYVGVIAGINDGLIANCEITGNSSLETDRSKSKDANRCLEVCVGGIAGLNNGVIGYCTVNGLAISADTSEFEFGANSASANRNALYVGGIAGKSSGSISYSRAGSETSIEAYAKAVGNTSDRITPYLTCYAGGIVGDPDAKDRLTSVYSECTDIVAGGYVYNEGTYWGVHRYNRDNEKVMQGHYYPMYSFYDARSETNTEWEKVFHPEYVYWVGGENSGYTSLDPFAKSKLKERCDKEAAGKDEEAANAIGAPSYNDDCFSYSEPEYFTFIIPTKTEYEVGSTYIDIDTLSVYDISGNKIEANFVGCYGFDSSNASLTATKAITVTVFYTVEYDGKEILKAEELELTIGKNRLTRTELVGFMEAPLNINASEEACLNAIFEDGFDVIYYYANGEKIVYSASASNNSEFTITGIDTTAIGTIKLTITHGDVETVIYVKVSCSHPGGIVYTSTVGANCKFMGYDVYECADCDMAIHKNYTTGNHNYVVVDGSAATCHEPGYTQSVMCSICETVFESSEWIQALPHNYITVENALATLPGFAQNSEYVNKDYHYCTNGDHYEPHQYVVTESSSTEGKIIYIYTCVTCGYVSELVDENVYSDSSKIPTVFITDGYVLGEGDEVVVYVQILNNPGFNGANFGIRYTDGLELLGYEESSMVPAQLRVNNEVHNGYNFLWASGSGDSIGDGYLLKLTFRYVATDGAKQTVNIVYGMQQEQDDYGDDVNNLGGFTSSTDKNVITRFMTHSGTISLVEHLPGDVNSDGCVDIMDATIIAWSIVGKTDSDGNKITVERRYADVNLDGKVDLNDVIAVLQSVSGRYGTNLLNSEYKLILNLVGYNNENVQTSYDVNFYNENSVRAKWTDNVDFAAVEAEMNRLGYTFVGWYTRLVGGVAVDVNANMTFDDMQGVQMLYARWEKNKVIFDMSGANGEAFGNVEYNAAQPTITPETPTWEYDVEYYVDSFGLYDEGNLAKTFLGWYLDGVLVTEYNLETPNIGTKTLVARWSETYNWTKPTETRTGYANITDWYYKQAYNSAYLIGSIDDAVIAEIEKSGFKIYGQPNIITYTITYNDLKGATNANDTTFNVTKDLTLTNLDSVTGYDFTGWYDQDGNKVVRINGKTGDMILTAKWSPKIYEITVKGTDVNNFTTSGVSVTYSATDRTLFTLYYKYGVGYYLESNCANKLPANYFASYCANQPGYSNYEIAGIYSNTVSNNAHSNASVSSDALVLKADTSVVKMPELSEANRTGTLYAKILPKKYTITFNHSSHNLLDNTFVSGTWSGDTLKIDYNASNGTYTLTNISQSDPHTGLNQWLTLEAGVTYMMHMDVASTTGTNSVQVFYAIDGAYAEANSLHFSGSQTHTFTVPTTGKYLIRIDNDCGGNATISNFWVSKARTETLDVYYNEAPANISIPTSVFYNFTGYKYSGSVNYYNASGAPLQPYAISGNATFDAQWTQKYTGTYIKTQQEFRNIKNNTSGTYYLVCDIDLLKEHWTPIGSFSGTINGLGHTLYGLSYEFIGSSGDYTKFGMFRTFSGNMLNLTIDSPYVHTEKSTDGQDIDFTGVIAGQMTGGTISNVTIVKPAIYGGHYRNVTKSGTYVNSYVGGFIGQMTAGTISNCSIQGGYVHAWAAYPSDSADGHAFAGGIVGHMTGGTVSNCSRADSTVVKAQGEQNADIKTPNSAIRAAAGGLVGSRDGGTVRGTSSANNLVSSVVTGKNGSSYSWARKEAIVGTGGQG